MCGIISDEIHSDLMLDGHKHIPMASVSSEIAAITTTCIAPSKTFNLAGLQSSTIVYDTVEHKDAYVAELKRMDIARNNCFSLVATMAAYEQGEEWLNQLLVYLSGNMRFIREFCAEHLPELKPNTPEATYLCWIDASALGMDDAGAEKVLRGEGRRGLRRRQRVRSRRQRLPASERSLPPQRDPKGADPAGSCRI